MDFNNGYNFEVLRKVSLMKARIPMSSTSRKAMDEEIKRQILEYDKKHMIEFDAMVLFNLYSEFGFGAQRLRKFYDSFKKLYKELQDQYCMPDDVPFICIQKLKDLGVDLESWERES